MKKKKLHLICIGTIDGVCDICLAKRRVYLYQIGHNVFPSPHKYKVCEVCGQDEEFPYKIATLDSFNKL